MSMFSLLQLLDDGGVDYVLVGGLAVTMRGYQRLTMDVDVVLAMTPANLKAFIDTAKNAHLEPVMPVALDALADPQLLDQWHAEKGMLAFAIRHPEQQSTVIDILIRPSVPFEELKRNSQPMAVGNLRVPVASIHDLIRLKTGTGRSKDALDIEELKKLLPADER